MQANFYLLAVAAALLCPAPLMAQEQEGEAAEPEPDIIVQATRSNRRVQDEPIRVEVVGREEIEEKLLMRPGNIAMLVSETPGVRVQTTSPALGAANVRIQGLKGRYSQILADGLPLYGGQTPSIGLLQIPPTDLGQVEIIKGAGSALYGASALGGVINLVSRRPAEQPRSEALVNLTTRGGQDVTAYQEAHLSEAFAASIIGGFNRQDRQDLDDDGWIDMPGYERWTVRPRLFWEGAGGARAFATVGALTENRRGGTLPGRTVPDGSEFPQNQRSRRLDAGLTADLPIAGLGSLGLRAAAVTQSHRHRFGDVVERDRHRTLLTEASLGGSAGDTDWLVGAAVQIDGYRSRTFPAFDYDYTVPALFAQGEHDFGDTLTLAGSIRWDGHSEYGGQVSPRLSLLYRPGPWTVRASVARGFYAPTPFVEEIEAAGLQRLRPLRGLDAEIAHTGSLDIGYARGPWELSASAFASFIDDAVQLRAAAGGGVELANIAGTTRTRGIELLARWRHGELGLTGSYVHVHATEPDPIGSGRREVQLTPRDAAGLVAVWERHGRARLGFEAYYTGRQTLDDNPFRDRGKPFVQLGVLGEMTFGPVSLFLNAENLLNVRQTRYDPLVRPSRASSGAWTVDAWAPTDGFVLNGGARFRFGGGDDTH